MHQCHDDVDYWHFLDFDDDASPLGLGDRLERRDLCGLFDDALLDPLRLFRPLAPPW